MRFQLRSKEYFPWSTRYNNPVVLYLWCPKRIQITTGTADKMPKTKEAKDQRKASAKEAKKEKQLIKAHKKKAKEQGLSVEEEDIETLLKQFDVKKLPPPEVHGKLIPCDQPSPRSSSTFTQLPGYEVYSLNEEILNYFLPSYSGDYFLFGGEFYEGSKVVVYNEGYRWNADKNEWRLVDPPIAPKPRCSHQAAVYKDSLYVFGGEFATIEQFHHFRDLWKFNPKTNTWEEVQCTGVGPSARSGHRMVRLLGMHEDTPRRHACINATFAMVVLMML